MDLIEARNWAFIQDPPPADVEPVQHLLARYSEIPTAQISAHIRSVRDAAWAISRYPYIGRWKFLRLLDIDDSRYKQTLFRLRLANSRDVVLDVGCCVAPLLRQLRAEGISGSQLYGTELEPKFVDLGYLLFKDRDTLGASFVLGDMLDFDDNRLHALHGKVTIIHATSFFHLFNWLQQLGIGKRLVSFIKPGTTNAMVFGRQMGTRKPGNVHGQQRAAYLHNETSFQKLWDEIGSLTGTRWTVMFDDVEGSASDLCARDDDPRPIDFTVYQIP